MSTNPLTSTLAALLERALQAALALDAEARQAIAELDGQILLLDLTALPNTKPLRIRVNCRADPATAEGSLSIMADSVHNSRAPNAIVSGNVTDVLASLWSAELPTGVSIQGDERLLMSLKHCFRSLTPDWRQPVEEFIARFSSATNRSAPGAGQALSDVLGQAELAFDTLRTTLRNLSRSASEQTRTASGKFWAKEDDLEGFVTRLESLQLSVDRLRAEVVHLQTNSHNTHSVEQDSES